MLPPAYFISVIDKIKTINQQPTFMAKLKNNLMFIPLGIPILCANLMADLVYFWVEKFKDKEDLKVIIVPLDYTTVKHSSLRDVMNAFIKFNQYKIKTTKTSTLIKQFQNHLSINQNIQFLMYGQIIPEGGW